MQAIDMDAGGYTGSFNVRADGSVTSFAQPGGGNRQPRTRSMAHTTDCLVTRADGSQYRIAKGTRNARKPRANVARINEPKVTTRATTRTAASIGSTFDAAHAVSY